MATGGNRWWGSRSEFPWEQDALDFLRQRMPSTEPYRAWTTFSFTAKSGHVREVDLLMVTPSGLCLVEIKSHQGRLVNSGATWMFHHHGRVSTIENPLHLANRKAVELKEQLQWALRRNPARGLRVPYIKAAVFLSDPTLMSELDEAQLPGVYARGHDNGLPAIWEDLLESSYSAGSSRTEVTFSRKMPELMDAIGIQGYRKHRTVGTWRLEPKAMDAGPTWEDYLAENTALEGDHRRVRLYLSELRASREAQESTRRAARREYLVLQGIDHPGIVKAEQFSDDHDAGPAIVFPHRPEWLRLDHYMAQYGDGLDVETRLAMIRQLAEAVAHAHRRHLYHRALAARSVYVAFRGAGYRPTLKIVDWQAAARPGGGSVDAPPGRTSTLAGDVATAAGHIERSAEAYLAPEFGRAEAESVPLDIFGLGALAYLIMTGAAPADGRGALARRLTEEHCLTPSAVDESITPQMDDVVQNATQLEVFKRFDSVKDFLEYLDLIEEDLTAPDVEPDQDPLDAVRGTVVNGWTVQRNLGQGSTSRTFLAERETPEGTQTGVLKVALTEAAADRLHAEAALLGGLRSPRIVGLIEGPFDVADRTVVVLEQAGQATLAEHIKRQGRLSPDELEKFGDELFDAVDYLEDEGVRHRDIKPDNLAIRRLANNTSRLVLLDFSMAGTPDTAVRAGTPDYRDPFVGTDRRPRYDDHAERYSIAVTLHEMAAAERPSWGDGMAEAEFIDKAESTPQISEDRFDAGLRDALAAFFRKALHRDADQRFASLKQMRDAWRGMFLDLDETAPPTTPSSTDDDTEDVKQARKARADTAVPTTQLVEAGLSPRALSAAIDGLGVSTVGELMAVPGARVHRLRHLGIGSGPRNELLSLASGWRTKFNSKESVAAVAKDQRKAAEDVSVAGTDAKERLKRLSLDEIAERLVPKSEGQDAELVTLALAVPGPDGSKPPLDPWASQREIADHKGVKPTDVSQALAAARRRWTADSAIKPLREDVITILTEKGRILEGDQLAAELLARRGSGLTDPTARRAVAGATLRVAIETEERLDGPRLAKRRTGPGGKTVLVALRAPEGSDLPDAADLFDYAEELGERADELAGLNPLPSAVTVRGRLREVVSGTQLLPDTALVALAAAASTNAAVTARLELYPIDLDPVRALELAQVAGYLGGKGITPNDLRRRVLARFPRMTKLPESPTALFKALRKAGYEAEWSKDGKHLVDRRFDVAVRSYSGGYGRTSTTGRTSTDQITQRLLASVDSGGFLALKTRIRYTEFALPVLSTFEDVTPINVTAEFTRALRQIVAARGKPTWTTMLDADPSTAPPVFHQLIAEAFAEVEKTIHTTHVALLYDATPLARYKDGPELLARLADAARDPHEAPHGLWLLCPMADPKKLPLLDDTVVPTNTSNERLVLPRQFAEQEEPGRAS
ncbi:BREX system serine/threonine kinase PglW [Actinomadura decatromicini]|uniref:non-specific serine/threonine protein kinase n=1 Tax=Actinomadura decatromicini TaxID=2604572 RepID=A0A5D3F5H1_9ACTN|nr:BREX system serine/threonine kinase PglW [Actinomadura decatromicini]TYK43413.1 BREX system serine/threonine kinase PglW [Actinomadura decatromicini]